MRRSWLGVLALSLGCFSDAPPSSTDAGTTTMPGTSDDGSTSADPATSTAAETNSADETAAPQVCYDGSTCIAAPDDWMGPFVLALVASGSEAPPCAAPYDLLFGVPLQGGLMPGNVECNCACSQLAGASACDAELLKYEAPACAGDPSSSALSNPPGSCVVTGGVDSVDYNPNPSAPPDCVGMMGEPEIVAPSFEHDVVLCGLQDPAAECDAGICVPTRPQPFSAVCIAHQGDSECPDDFADAHAVFVGVEDERQCACECDAVEADCTPTIYAATDSDCLELDAGTADCVDTSDPSIVATTWYPTAEAQCNAVQEITGEVVGSGRHTLCCRS